MLVLMNFYAWQRAWMASQNSQQSSKKFISQEKSMTEINGQTSAKNEQYDHLKINGSLKFDNLSIKDVLEINGSGKGKNLNCKVLKVNGSFDVRGLHSQDIVINGSLKGNIIEVTESTKLTGDADISNGQFKAMEIACQTATFSNCSIANDIVVKKITTHWFQWSQSKKQIIRLKEGTVISGDIIFEQEGGEVHIFNESEVKGEIKKGRLVTK